MQRISLFTIAALLSIWRAGAAAAQQIQTDTTLPVYVDVRASASDASMATFAGKLLELALTDVKGLQLRKDLANPCTAFPVPNRATPLEDQSLSKVVMRPEPDGARFVVIRMILEEHRAEGRANSPDWLLDYLLTEGDWSNGRPICPDSSSLHQAQRMPQAKLLDALNLAGRVIASNLSDRSTQSRVGVMVLVRRQGRNASQDLVDDLSGFLASRIAATQEFRPFQRDAPNRNVDYLLDLQISLSSKETDPKAEVSGTLTVRSAKNAATTTTLLAAQPANALPGFYRQVADTSLRRLYEARAAADLALNRTTLEGASSPRLISEARALLCIDATDLKCTVQADAALAVLGQLPPEASSEYQSLLGRAQAAAGRYADSAQTFDKILESADLSPEQRLDALLRAGDGYASGREYDKAATRYGTWLGQAEQARVSEEQSLDVALKQAQTLRIGHAVDGAIDALMVAANRWPRAGRVDQELGRLIPELNKVQLANLLVRLTMVPQQDQFTSVKIRASRRLASEYLRDGAYPDAEQTLNAVAAADVTGQVSVDLASLYYSWARSNGLTNERKSELLQRGVAAVLPAVRSRNANADGEFVLLNHEGGDDLSSRLEFERMLSSGSADAGALLSLMLVCNEYVVDFDCADKAANALDRIGPGHDAPTRQVNILEVKVVHGDLDTAASLKDRLVSDAARMGDYRYIVFFYAAWIELAAGNRDAGANMVSEWRHEMESLRAAKTNIDWLFNGARKALTNPRGLAKEDANFLLSMISAMESPTLPLPEQRRG
jgi:tetratricopeptide (TPR) repeat protein